jgi:hypothetical protein
LGYQRIKGELKKLGHDLPTTTIQEIIRRSGIDPSRHRDGRAEAVTDDLPPPEMSADGPAGRPDP